MTIVSAGTRKIDLRGALEDMHERLRSAPCAISMTGSSDGEVFVILAGSSEAPLLNQGGRILIAVGYERAALERLYARIGELLGKVVSRDG